MDRKSAGFACDTMGVQFHAYDRYIADAVEWLGKQGPVTIEAGEDFWSVTGPEYASADEELTDALSGAIHARAAFVEDAGAPTPGDASAPAGAEKAREAK
ncbi:MAG: hypothetical protein ACYSWU_13120 [Planctomycetota bacterium]|jgi:hypothetical protein